MLKFIIFYKFNFNNCKEKKQDAIVYICPLWFRIYFFNQ